jgi:hypothetical protein
MAPTSQQPPSEGEWEDFTSRSESSADRARELLHDFVTMVDDVLSSPMCPAFVAASVRPQLALLNIVGQWILSKVEEIMLGIGFPLRAYLLADDWTERVATPVGNAASAISHSNLEVRDYWWGPAGRAYGNKATEQRDAMLTIVEIVDEIKGKLQIIGGVMAGFYVAIGMLVIVWIKLLIDCCAATAAFPPDAPGTVSVAAVATGAVWTAIGGVITAAGGLVGSELEAWTDLKKSIASQGKFKDGHWPKATSDTLADATWKDGDKSDWELQR